MRQVRAKHDALHRGLSGLGNDVPHTQLAQQRACTDMRCQVRSICRRCCACVNCIRLPLFFSLVDLMQEFRGQPAALAHDICHGTLRRQPRHPGLFRPITHRESGESDVTRGRDIGPLCSSPNRSGEQRASCRTTSSAYIGALAFSNGDRQPKNTCVVCFSARQIRAIYFRPH